MIRLNDAQHRRVKKLTRCHCANNVRGCCLLLDDGEPCVCVPYAARRNAAERKRRQRAKARCVTV